jgi:hypothetical protein
MRPSIGALTQRRFGQACTVAVGALFISVVAAMVSPEPSGSHASANGTVYGGESRQDFPVVIETNRNGRRIVKATIAIRLTCTAGGGFAVPDGYTSMPVSRKRKFSASFGPVTNRNDDGTTTDFEGSVSGTFNRARTKASGKWSLKATDHDATGATTDTCDSGSVSWTAKS